MKDVKNGTLFRNVLRLSFVISVHWGNILHFAMYIILPVIAIVVFLCFTSKVVDVMTFTIFR